MDAQTRVSGGLQRGVSEPVSPLLTLFGPVVRDMDEARALFRSVLLFEANDGDDLCAAEEILPESLRDVLRTLIIPAAQPLGRHLSRMEGKWLRAGLVLLSARLGGAVPLSAVRTAVALELVHLATLIHDDIVDRADLRRGVPVLNHVFGATQAVLMGDYLFSKAFHLLTSTGSVAIMDVIARRTNQVCLGEIRQSCMSGNLGLSEREYLSLVACKTASLIAACAKVGALLGKVEPYAVDAMERFGVAFGIAFQIRDDVLDYTADATVLGKTMLTDLAQGKATLPLIHLRDRLLDSGQMALWEQLPSMAADDVVDLLHREGCIDSANRTCLAYADRAQQELATLRPRVPHTEPVDALSHLCRFVVQREM